jgi:hypothetical protein
MVVACAGGGGGGGGAGTVPVSPPPLSPPPAPPSPPPPPPPPPPGPAIPSSASAEYNANWGLDGINVRPAWEAGATGRGVIVGVIDDGIDPSQPDLIGAISPLSIDIVSGRGQLQGAGTHGSELAGFIGARFNGSGVVGVAYDSTILAVRAEQAGNCGSSCSFSTIDLARGLRYAVDNGARVVNFSLGSDSPSGATFENTLAEMTARGVIVVISAGNEGDPDPRWPARYAANPAISNGLIIVAGALTQSGEIASFSNLAGVTQNWYVVAPGSRVVSVDANAPGPTDVNFQTCDTSTLTCRMQGTSYSSPAVAGAMAVLLQAFPGLTPQQTVDLFLRSASDRGAPGIDPIWGRGRADLGRAFSPIGPLRVAMPSGETTTSLAPIGEAGPAFGDAISSAGAWTSFGFDDYGRAFSMSLAHQWVAPQPVSALPPGAPVLWREAAEGQASRYHFVPPEPSLLNELPGSRGLREEPQTAFIGATALGDTMSLTTAAGVPVMGARLPAGGHLVQGDPTLGIVLTQAVAPGLELGFVSQSSRLLGSVSGQDTERHMSALTVSRRLGFGEVMVTLGAGREDDGIAGLRWSQRWGAPTDSQTRFVGLSGETPLGGGFALSGQLEWGHVTAEGGGALGIAEPLQTTGGAVTLSRVFLAEPGVGDQPPLFGRLSLSVAQPLRVEDGALWALTPTADAYGMQRLRFDQRLIDAEPSGRQVDIRLGLDLYGDRFIVQGQIGGRAQPGHRADADTEFFGSIGLRIGL